MLWWMRRPFIKRMRRAAMRLRGPEKEAAAWASLRRQDAFARRWGLPLLTLVFNLFLASVALTFTFYAVLALYNGGFLEPPERLVRGSDR